MSVTVQVASPLRDYTGGKARIEARGATLKDVLADLDARFPGMRFRMIDEQQRIRQHIRIFIGMQEASDLQQPVPPRATVHLVCALSGG